MNPAMAKIRADLARHRKAFDLVEGDLGKKLCKAATDGVQECIAGEHAPDGTRWDDLSAAYEEWKSFHHPGNPMAVLHGTMANPREVAGQVAVTPEKATVTYGVSDRARQEAYWFQEGDDDQPGRRFWGFTDASKAEVKQLLDARFKAAMK